MFRAGTNAALPNRGQGRHKDSSTHFDHLAETENRAVHNAFRDLSKDASYFREKLIQEFNIIESLDATAASSIHGLRYTSRDFMDEDIRTKLLQEAPSAVIWFPGIKRVANGATKLDRRLIRTKNQFFLPAGAWAAWLTKDLPAYHYAMMAIIFLHAITIGVLAQYDYYAPLHYDTIASLNIVGAVCVCAFVNDIILHWVDSIEGYFTDWWNVFDFVITAVLIAPTFISLYTPPTALSPALKTLKILSVFKLITRTDNLRTIIITILQALQSMTYVVLFIGMFGIVFAHIGINLYSDYVTSEAHGLLFQDYWATMGESFQTIFILFTLDTWAPINANLAIITNPICSYLFILVWTWIGAFIFRNIFMGVMIHNFKRISTVLEEEDRAIRHQKKLDKIRSKLKSELLARETIR
ncbi:Cation channel sperm-associated protein 2 [Kappamyces sp. JEL0680]|nr:Cation channel sperm-associated protein 2 [Kappamyces sp. JEL0680]